MTSLLPPDRTLSVQESADMLGVHLNAEQMGTLCDLLERHNTKLFQRVEDSVPHGDAREVAIKAMVASDDALMQAKARLREGFALLQQTILLHPEGY
jgi:hypothetical protein